MYLECSAADPEAADDLRRNNERNELCLLSARGEMGSCVGGGAASCASKEPDDGTRRIPPEIEKPKTMSSSAIAELFDDGVRQESRQELRKDDERECSVLGSGADNGESMTSPSRWKVFLTKSLTVRNRRKDEVGDDAVVVSHSENVAGARGSCNIRSLSELSSSGSDMKRPML